MEKLKLTRQNLGRVFNFRFRRACVCRAMAYITKRLNLKLKTQPKHLLGSLQLAFALLVLWLENVVRLSLSASSNLA